MKHKGLHRTLLILFVLGMLISLFLVYEHFSTVADKYCTFGKSFSCGIVNKSPYANLDGFSYLFTMEYGWNLPLINITQYGAVANLLTSNAFLGFLTLVFLFFLFRAYEHKKSFLWISSKKTLYWLQGILIFSVLYGLYLVYIQHFILKTYCLFCLGLDVVFITSFLIVWRLVHET